MKHFLVPSCVAALALCASALPWQDASPLDAVSRSAQQELARSVAELDQLRAQIAAEKIPLAEELTALEARLAQLREEYDGRARSVDAGKLELSRTQTTLGLGEDELTYVSNLLDEYARNFESKIDPCELQPFGAAIEEVKRAAEDSALTVAEKLARQTAFVETTVQRLLDVVGGMCFAGIGIDLQGAVANGRFAIVGPLALFCADDGGATGLVVPQSGSTRPLIRPLEGAMQAGIAALVGTGEGLLPLDPSLGGALKELVQETNLVHIFEKGGPIMWPLLLASILALGTVLERLVFLMNERVKRDPKALDGFFAAVTAGDWERAIGVSKASKFYVVRALGYALTHKEQSLANALLYAQALEIKRFRRGIPILDTVITLAPLLGLLGTVTGMMGSFALIGGELSAPGAITGGIAEALIATAFGLGIAITALLPFNFLNTRLDEARDEMESAAAQLELLVRSAMGGSAPLPHEPHAREIELVAQRAPVGSRREGHARHPDDRAVAHHTDNSHP